MLQHNSVDKLDVFFSQYRSLQYKSRTVISPMNEIQSFVFYIKSGYLRVFRISEQGEELTLTILKPKDFFPLTYGMTDTDTVSSYYLEAITPLELWKVHLDQFQQFLESQPDVYAELTKRVLVRFNGVLTKMEYLIFNNAYTKIIATLISCARKFGEQKGDHILIDVPLTHKDIATLVGITRETTSLEMKKLEKQGFVSRNGRYLIINKIEKLEEEIVLQTGGPVSLYQSI